MRTAGSAPSPVPPGSSRVPQRAADEFHRVYRRAPEGVWSAPGRVNLIGEHTDYNDGFVLPFALPNRIAAAASSRTDGMLYVTTVTEDGQSKRATPIRVDELQPGAVTGWVAYPSGVIWSLRNQGIDSVRTGADLVITADVPAGAGLASSHALECAVALALLGLAGVQPGGDTADSPSLADIARWVQHAENDFVGAPTGLLDQTASLCCTAGHALFLDVRTGHSEQVPLDATAAGLRFLVMDTRTSHSHAGGEYGARREGCEQAAAILGVSALRDIEPADVDGALSRLPEKLRPLVRHVVTENARVLAIVQRLHASQLAEIGPLLSSSHRSMRDDYRISSAELDLAVDAALDAGAVGARMTGGGFGGSAIALVPEAAQEEIKRAVLTAFAEHTYTEPRLFTVTPSAGAGRDC